MHIINKKRPKKSYNPFRKVYIIISTFYTRLAPALSFCLACNSSKRDRSAARLLPDPGGAEFLPIPPASTRLVDGRGSVLPTRDLGKSMVVAGGLDDFLVASIADRGMGRARDIGRVDWRVSAEAGAERALDLRLSVLVADDRALVTEGPDESFEVLVIAVASVEVAGRFNRLAADVASLPNARESRALVAVEAGALAVADLAVGPTPGSGRPAGLDDAVTDVLGIRAAVVESPSVVCDRVMVRGAAMLGREFGARETVAAVDTLLDIDPDRFLTSVLEEGTMLALGTRAVRVACVSRFTIRAARVSAGAAVVICLADEVGLALGNVECVLVDLTIG